MNAAFAWTALLMGLAGGPHCLAMCAAPCSALAGNGGAGARDPGAPQAVHWAPRVSSRRVVRLGLFHAGRLAGYALAGGLAAFAMESLAWVTQQTWSLRPVWTLTHVAVLAWGLLMMAQARQPAWVERAGRAAWRYVQPLVAAPGGVFAAGFFWALMPCGLLYSALLVAALSNGPVQGAVSMLCFAVGSGAWLVGGPLLWQQVRARLNLWRASWGTRLAGLMLFGIAAWALWMDLVYKPSLWCR